MTSLTQTGLVLVQAYLIKWQSGQFFITVSFSPSILQPDCASSIVIKENLSMHAGCLLCVHPGCVLSKLDEAVWTRWVYSTCLPSYPIGLSVFALLQSTTAAFYFSIRLIALHAVCVCVLVRFSQGSKWHTQTSNFLQARSINMDDGVRPAGVSTQGDSLSV